MTKPRPARIRRTYSGVKAKVQPGCSALPSLIDRRADEWLAWREHKGPCPKWHRAYVAPEGQP